MDNLYNSKQLRTVALTGAVDADANRTYPHDIICLFNFKDYVGTILIE